MSVTHSMFVPASQRTAQHGLGLKERPPEPQPLSEKHRPRLFKELVGQSYAVMMLQDFVDDPHPQAMVFSGETGTGKTSAAFCLANELSINRDWNFQHVKSGEMDVESVQTALKMSRFCGINDGYKMIICDEADMMSAKAKGLWLSALEDIPAKTVIIFTTNEPDKLGQRFIDRCEHIKFESNARTLKLDGQSYLNRLWVAEGLKGAPPNVDDAKGVIIQNVISFRRIARFVEQEQRKQSAQPVKQASNPISLSVCNAAKQNVRL